LDRNINLLYQQWNIALFATRDRISLSILHFPFSILDKASFVNHQMAAFFAATGEFGVKKRGFVVVIFDPN
jgi:hypothetical protein